MRPAGLSVISVMVLDSQFLSHVLAHGGLVEEDVGRVQGDIGLGHIPDAVVFARIAPRVLHHVAIRRVKVAVAERAKVNPKYNTLKIAIMGCIVNGPGEMADADYGYVGAARGKVSLYKNKECIEKNIPEAEAIERLIAFIDSDLSS